MGKVVYVGVSPRDTWRKYRSVSHVVVVSSSALIDAVSPDVLMGIGTTVGVGDGGDGVGCGCVGAPLCGVIDDDAGGE